MEGTFIVNAARERALGDASSYELLRPSADRPTFVLFGQLLCYRYAHIIIGSINANLTALPTYCC